MATVTDWEFNKASGWYDPAAAETSASGYVELSGGMSPPPPVTAEAKDAPSFEPTTDPAAYAKERLELINKQMDGLTKQLNVSASIPASSAALQLDAIFSMIMEVAPQLNATDKAASRLVLKISGQYATAATTIYKRLNWGETAKFFAAKGLATAVETELKAVGGKRPKIPFMYSLTKNAGKCIDNLWNELFNKRMATKPQKGKARQKPAAAPRAASTTVDPADALTARLNALRLP